MDEMYDLGPQADGGCPYKQTCPIFPKLELTLEIWRASYCDSLNYRSCKRYQLAKTGESPVITMLPNGDHLQRLAD